MLGDTSSYQGLRGVVAQEDVPAAITDVGCERDINEDRYAVIDSTTGRMWVVCDGMGGVQGGELAAQLAIDAMRRGLEAGEHRSPEDALIAAIEEANRRIVLRRQNPAFGAMGTTVVAALVRGDELVLGYAGDSRAYLVRQGEIQQLSVDHTYVQDLVEKGEITAEEAMRHPQAHVLTKCLGAEPRLEIERQNFWIWDVAEGEPQDLLVLCSDGLYSHVTDHEIAQIVSSCSPQESCTRLVELAKERGGYDNITVTVLPLGGQLREEAPTEAQAGARAQQLRTAAIVAPAVARRPELPLSKKLVVMGLLSFIGAVMAVLVVLYQLSVE